MLRFHDDSSPLHQVHNKTFQAVNPGLDTVCAGTLITTVLVWRSCKFHHPSNFIFYKLLHMYVYVYTTKNSLKLYPHDLFSLLLIKSKASTLAGSFDWGSTRMLRSVKGSVQRWALSSSLSLIVWSIVNSQFTRLFFIYSHWHEPLRREPKPTEQRQASIL